MQKGEGTKPVGKAPVELDGPVVYTGVVKWFHEQKGYGFLIMDGSVEQVFVHYTAIVADGFRALKQGQRVSFQITIGPKGRQAGDVHMIPPATPPHTE